MAQGYLALVLHNHLPYVRHPEDENFLEENWLYEAITETYLPLIQTFQRLKKEQVDFHLTMAVSPPLLSMLTDRLLQDRYQRYLERLLELSQKELCRTSSDANFHKVAQMYQQNYLCNLETYRHYNRNIITALRQFQNAGYLEIITCSATHGLLPLLDTQPQAIRAQIKNAVDLHTQHFGQQPKGIWLPECAYAPGLDEILSEYGIKYFFVDTHSILFAKHRPRYGVYAPIICPGGTAAFGRDTESSKQVWSKDEGYPGDYYYREFYRDIGYDLPLDYIGPYIHPDGIRLHTGMKYYRITGKSNHKEVYQPDIAREKAAFHAGNFMFNREQQIKYLSQYMDRQPLIVAPYDAELFGHWWYEGPVWLEYLLKKIHYDQNTVKTITPSAYLEIYPVNQITTPNMSTWGDQGYFSVWLNQNNDWTYRYLHHAAERMSELSVCYGQTSGIKERALKQAARELLLAQSSDWSFIMNAGTTVEYAVKRFKNHINNFNALYKEITADNVDEGRLKYLEDTNNIFPDVDYKVYGHTKALQK